VKNISDKKASGLLQIRQLALLRRRAMRAGVWFRRLRQIDRVLVDLTIKLTDCVRSVMLANSLLSIVGKVEGLLESRFARKVREIGFSLACKCSVLGVSWGNRSSKSWAGDPGYARFLAVMKINGGPP
jgi:hypothetical protein